MQIVWIGSPQLEQATDEALAAAETVADAQRRDGGLEEIGIAEMRRRLDEGGGGFPAATRLDTAETVPIDADRSLRIFRSEHSRGVYLMVHSGGWLSGGPDLQDRRMADLAASTGLHVACANYRLAPEHTHPAAVDDVEAAAQWLIEHAPSEFGTNRIIIGGESAGAHLAALALLRLRDRHDSVGHIAGANFMYGIFDLSLSPSARLAGDAGIVLPTHTLEYMVSTYLGAAADTEQRRHIGCSPIYADLSNLVPARFVVGELDPLLDDTLLMSSRWRAAGNTTIAEVYPASIHAFDAFPTQMAAIATDRQSQWMIDLLREPQSG